MSVCEEAMNQQKTMVLNENMVLKSSSCSLRLYPPAIAEDFVYFFFIREVIDAVLLPFNCHKLCGNQCIFTGIWKFNQVASWRVGKSLIQ